MNVKIEFIKYIEKVHSLSFFIMNYEKVYLKDDYFSPRAFESVYNLHRSQTCCLYNFRQRSMFIGIS
jgi:hypothetical protein